MGAPMSATRSSRASAQRLVATIDTGTASQVRVHLSTWRGETKLEIKPYTKTVVFMPAGAGVTLPLEKLDELIAALKAVQR